MVYPILKRTLFPLLRLFIKSVDGVENIPNPPAIFAANHSSYLDPFFIVREVVKKKNKKVHFLAMRGRFGDKLGDTISKKWAGCVFLDNPAQAFNSLLTLLKRGNYVALFPEGHRTLDGKIREKGKSGAVRLSLDSKAPLVPIAIKGAYDIAAGNKLIPKFKRCVRINMGEPYTIESNRVDKFFLNKKTKELLNRIKTLYNAMP